MSDHVSNLRRTRADMLGTDDEEHYWECHRAADRIEQLEAELKKAYAEIQKINEREGVKGRAAALNGEQE